MARSEFAIVGAGALGSILAAHLIRSGRSVALLARGQRAQQLRELGLRIKGLSEIALPVEVITDPAQLRETGTLIIATKTPGSEQTMASLRHVQVERAVSIQNGVMKDELLSQTYGRERTLGALADTSGELLASGEVLFTRNMNLFVGELDGSMSDTARGIVKAIDDAGVRATLVPDIVSREWSKFVGWVGFVSLSLTTRVATWKFLSDPDAALLIARLTRELEFPRPCARHLAQRRSSDLAARAGDRWHRGGSGRGCAENGCRLSDQGAGASHVVAAGLAGGSPA